MSAEVFATWFRRRGYRVEKTVSSYWAEFGPRVFQAFPYHWLLNPEDGELRDFIHKHRAVAVRYSTPLSAQEGRLSYHAVRVVKPYRLEDLGKWARKNIRRGLRNCFVEQITFERLLQEGWALQADTLARQGRSAALLPEDWRNLCLTAEDLPGFEAWGAIVGKELAASVVTFSMGSWYYMLYQQCHSKFLGAHVNNALSFVVTTELLSREHCKGILYGLHSLDAPPSVDEFKFRMGYHAQPVRQRVVFHPIISPMVSATSYLMLKAAIRVLPGSVTLAKAEGILRFSLEGKRPLGEQSPPPPLDAMGSSEFDLGDTPIGEPDWPRDER